MSSAKAISKRSFLILLLFAIIIMVATTPFYVPRYTIIVLTTIFMNIVLAVSWSIFSGPTGYVSLATAAFFGVGIYISAVLGNLLPVPVIIIIGGLLSFLIAFSTGLLTLRLRGMYFIIFTFGLGELLRHSSLWWETNITGTVGRWVPLLDQVTVYYYMLIIVLATLLSAYIIGRSKFGLALRSIGESEEAAAHIGINVTAVKTTAFAISAFFMGAAGVVMATRWTYIDPSIAFNPLIAFMPVLMAIFGGIRRIYGPILGALFFTLLAEALSTRFPYYYMLLFGITLITVVLFLPNGLIGLVSVMKKRRKGDLVA